MQRTADGIIHFDGDLQRCCAGIDLGCRLFLVLCTLVTAYTTFFEQGTNLFTVCPYPVLQMGEVWRLLTSNFAHSGFLHLAMNMLTLLSLGHTVERIVGTWCFVGLVVHFSLAIGVLYVALAQLFFIMERNAAWLTYCSVGFSGVDFALLVLAIEMRQSDTESLFGMVWVPARLYPFAVALLVQLLLPHISALGHGCGIAVGYLYCWGYLDVVMLSRDMATTSEAACLKLLNHLRILDAAANPSYHTKLPAASSPFLQAQEARERQPTGPWGELARRLGMDVGCQRLLPFSHSYMAVATQEDEELGEEGEEEASRGSSFPGQGLRMAPPLRDPEKDLELALVASRVEAEEEEKATSAYLNAGEERPSSEVGIPDSLPADPSELGGEARGQGATVEEQEQRSDNPS